MKRILLVDDETQILSALSRVFIDTDYEIFTAENGKDALQVLEQNEINLVMSDMRMPVMDGYELLKIVKQKYPKVIRIILSGYSEERTILQAVLKNIAKVYMFKPWNNEELLLCIEQLFSIEDQLNSKNLLNLINNTDMLQTIPSSHKKILSLIDNDADISQIAEAIENDFAISTKLLQLANSAFYGLKTGSVKHAATYLGLQNIKSIVLSASIFKDMKNSGEEGEFVKKIWDHAILTNKLLAFLYKEFLKKRLPEIAQSAGLLHNVGISVFKKQLIKQYIDNMRKDSDERENMLDIELKKFNVTHQEAGGYLLSWWELPFPIIEVALYHHRPFEPGIVNTELVASVHIVQNYAWEILNEHEFTPLYPEAFNLIGVDQQAFEERLNEEIWIEAEIT